MATSSGSSCARADRTTAVRRPRSDHRLACSRARRDQAGRSSLGARTTPGSTSCMPRPAADRDRRAASARSRAWPTSVERVRGSRLPVHEQPAEPRGRVAQVRRGGASLPARRATSTRRRIVEIGRFKGGSTVVMAAAMAPRVDAAGRTTSTCRNSGGVDGAAARPRSSADALERLGARRAACSSGCATPARSELPDPGRSTFSSSTATTRTRARRPTSSGGRRTLREGGHCSFHDAVDTRRLRQRLPGRAAGRSRSSSTPEGFELRPGAGTIATAPFGRRRERPPACADHRDRRPGRLAPRASSCSSTGYEVVGRRPARPVRVRTRHWRELRAAGSSSSRPTCSISYSLVAALRASAGRTRSTTSPRRRSSRARGTSRC